MGINLPSSVKRIFGKPSPKLIGSYREMQIPNSSKLQPSTEEEETKSSFSRMMLGTIFRGEKILLSMLLTSLALSTPLISANPSGTTLGF